MLNALKAWMLERLKQHELKERRADLCCRLFSISLEFAVEMNRNNQSVLERLTRIAGQALQACDREDWDAIDRLREEINEFV